jgi:hypothetical protein
MGMVYAFDLNSCLKVACLHVRGGISQRQVRKVGSVSSPPTVANRKLLPRLFPIYLVQLFILLVPNSVLVHPSFLTYFRCS